MNPSNLITRAIAITFEYKGAVMERFFADRAGVQSSWTERFECLYPQAKVITDKVLSPTDVERLIRNGQVLL